MRWHPGSDSNRQPLVLETSALPIELPTYNLAGHRGIEPRPQGFGDLYAAGTPVTQIVAGAEGFEPSHAGIKIQCRRPLGYAPIVELAAILFCLRTRQVEMFAVSSHM